MIRCFIFNIFNTQILNYSIAKFERAKILMMSVQRSVGDFVLNWHFLFNQINYLFCNE